MSGHQRDSKHASPTPKDSTSRDPQDSPHEGSTTADGGYAEKHGPRFDADGWGEANTSGGTGDGGSGSQGQEAGERSFDHGPDDRAAETAAADAALREPGERGAADAKPPTHEPSHESPPDDAEPPLSYDGRQRDYGQGGGQGYVHTGKPGAPGPDGKSD